MTELLGHSGDFALFGDGAHDGLTVVVSTATLDTFDPQPFASVDPTRWEEPDEALVPTEAYELAEQVLANAKPVTGTDVIIAAGNADRRSFAVPKAVQAEAQKALEWRKEHKRGGTEVGLNTARTLARGGSIGIQKVRHIGRYFPRHRVDKDAEGFRPGEDGFPSNGRIAHGLWGGDAAERWVNGILRREKDLTILAAATDSEPDEHTSAVIVALPAEDDPIQQVSSENPAHMTLVFLGKAADVADRASIERAVAQAAASAGPLTLTVTSREPLGDDQADVLMLDPAEMTAVRDQLMGDASVLAAHDAVEQFPSWTPHLTLGYPSSPAKGEPGDSITFDRLALLYGNDRAEFALSGADVADTDVADSEFDTYSPDQPHPFLPSPELDYACEVCLGGETSLVHASDDAIAPIAAAAAAARAGSETDAQDAVSADEFFVFATGTPDFFVSEAESLITGVFAFADGAWQQWDTLASGWVEAPEQSDVTPIDDSSAYAVARHMSMRPDAVAASAIDSAEWTLADMAQRSIPDYTAADLSSLDFLVDVAESAHADLQVRGLYLRSSDESCWYWSPSDAEWQLAAQCADGCTSIDAGAAREIALRLSGTSSLHAFDAAFERSAWIVGTALATDEGYTPEERSANASKQFRDALGRFARQGDTVHVTGGRTGRVKDYDEKTGRVKVQYDDNSEQDIDRRQVTKVGESSGQGSQSKRLDVSGIQAQPRAVKTTPVAMLPKLLPVMDRAALDSAMADYQAFIEAERKRKLESFAALTPKTSDVKPLYLAQVDPVDTQAVLELIALVPKTEKTAELRAFVRRNGGWELDAKMLARIKSVAPPPLVVLDNDTFGQVRDQVDFFYKEKAARGEETEAALRSVVASAENILWTEDGTLLPATALNPRDAALVAAGVPGVADTPSDIAAARRLKRYWLRGVGAAKIRWNTPGDWTRCVKHLSKYVGVRARGLCQTWHKEATGVYTGSRLNVGNKRGRGLRADGSALLLSTPTRILGAPGDVEAEGITSFDALSELELPSVEDMRHLSYRDDGHVLRVGERFLVDGGDGTYVLRVLDPAQTLGWSGEPAIICGRTLLREKKMETVS